jgi:hypothetical protein
MVSKLQSKPPKAFAELPPIADQTEQRVYTAAATAAQSQIKYNGRQILPAGRLNNLRASIAAATLPNPQVTRAVRG